MQVVNSSNNSNRRQVRELGNDEFSIEQRSYLRINEFFKKSRFSIISRIPVKRKANKYI